MDYNHVLAMRQTGDQYRVDFRKNSGYLIIHN